MKKEFIYVKPRTSRASERFENYMDRLHSRRVDERKNGKVFLSSITERYSFCINEAEDDHWEIVK